MRFNTMLRYSLLIWIYHSALLQKVDSQCAAGIRPLELTASTSPQYLTSPNYPSNYDNNLDCQWKLSGSATNSMMINIEDVDTETDAIGTCLSDSLTVHDGSTTAGASTTYCSGTLTTGIIVSSVDGNFYITFTSNAAITGRGFQILFFIINPANQVACGSDLTATSSEAFLLTTTLPAQYSAKLDCTYNLTAPTDWTINITYYFIDLEFDAACANDKLAVYDGASTSSAVLSSQCTTAAFYNFTSSLTTGNAAFIRFVTDAAISGYGFLLSYRAYLTTTNCSTEAIALTATTHHNYITTVDFGTTRYGRNLYCMWLITASTGEAIEVVFVELQGETFSLEYNSYCSYDYVILYDGNSTADSAINRFCGSSMVTHTYRSSSTDMLVLFRSDYAVSRNGFRLAYKAVDNTYPGCKKDYVNILSPLYNVESVYIDANRTYVNSTTSPNYPNYYSSYTDEYWLIVNDEPDLYSVILDITSISIEQSRGCLYDKLVIYNGSCIKDGPFYTACGYRETSHELVGSEFLVHFHSDGSFNRRGFSFDYFANFTNVTLPATTTTTTNGPPAEAVINAMKTALDNYTSDNLPNRDLTDAINANFDFYLVGINGLDEIKQTLTSTGQFEVTWNDSSLSWLPSKQQGVVRMLFPQDDVWKPDIVLMNGVTKIAAMGSSFMFVDVDYNGVCVWKPYQILKTTCKVDMTHYPYDKQTCTLKFSTWSSSGSDVTTGLGQLGLQIHSGFQKNSVWELLATETIQELENSQNVVKFVLSIKRKPAYVTFYISIPLVMLAYLNVFTFAIPCESGEKSGFCVTVFLSFIVILIVITTSMPDNSDSISLYGAYIFTMTLMSAIAVAVSVIQIRALTFQEEDHPIAKRIKTVLSAFEKRTRKMFKKIKSRKDVDESSSAQVEGKFSEYDEQSGCTSRVSAFEDTSDINESDEDLVADELRLQRELTAGSIMFDRDTTCLPETLVTAESSSVQKDEQNVENGEQCNNKEDSEVEQRCVGEEQDLEQVPVQNKVKFATDEFWSDNDDVSICSANNNEESKSNELDDQVKIESLTIEKRSFDARFVEEGNSPTLDESIMLSAQPPPYSSLTFGGDCTAKKLESKSRVGSRTEIIGTPLSRKRPSSVLSRNLTTRDPHSAVNTRPFSKLAQRMQHNDLMSENSDIISYDESSVGSYSDWESDVTEPGENENGDNDPSWPELVRASDALLFCVYFVITTILTISFFVPMALN